MWWRPGIGLGLVAMLASVALSACGSSPGWHRERPQWCRRRCGSRTPGWVPSGTGSSERPSAGLDHGLRRDHGGLGSAAGSRPRPAQPGRDVRQRRHWPYPATARGADRDAHHRHHGDQTSALIDALGLGRPNVLGWSMGSMIAQALAVLHPAQVRRLVLCATFPGTGTIVASPAARQAGAFSLPIRPAPTTRSRQRSRNIQRPAASSLRGSGAGGRRANWSVGTNAAGRRSPVSRRPLLSPTAPTISSTQSPMTRLARLVPGARLVLSPTPGTDSCSRKDRARFPVEWFLTGHPGS